MNYLTNFKKFCSATQFFRKIIFIIFEKLGTTDLFKLNSIAMRTLSLISSAQHQSCITFCSEASSRQCDIAYFVTLVKINLCRHTSTFLLVAQSGRELKVTD